MNPSAPLARATRRLPHGGERLCAKFNENMPIYLQIIRYFEVAVARGELEQGSKLPSVRETALELQVNPNTVQRAYQEMERTGLVVTKRGQGSFVTEDPSFLAGLRDNLASEAVTRFVADMQALGYQPHELASVIARLTVPSETDNNTEV